MGAGPHNEPLASPRNLFLGRKGRVAELFAELLGRSFLPFPHFAAVDHHIMRVAFALDLDLAKFDQSRLHISMFRGLIELQEIPNERRITEKILWREFEKARPVIFTAILDAVSMALRTLPTLKMPPLPRMADAAEWATAGETAFGFERWTFLRAYQGNLDEAAEVALDANPVGAAIRTLLEENDEWEGEPRELLEALDVLVSEKVQKQDDWPKNPQKLGQILRRIAPALRRAGIGYERPPRGKSRIIRLSRAAKKPPGENDDDTDADSRHFHVV